MKEEADCSLNHDESSYQSESNDLDIDVTADSKDVIGKADVDLVVKQDSAEDLDHSEIVDEDESANSDQSNDKSNTNDTTEELKDNDENDFDIKDDADQNKVRIHAQQYYELIVLYFSKYLMGEAIAVKSEIMDNIKDSSS